LGRPAAADDRHRWWIVIGYEVSMLRGLQEVRANISIKSADPQRTAWLLGNVIPEGRVLHTRNLCDFCTSTHRNDIKPRDLFDDYDRDPRYEPLKGLIRRLREQYGKTLRARRAGFSIKCWHTPPRKEETGSSTPPSWTRSIRFFRTSFRRWRPCEGARLADQRNGGEAGKPRQRGAGTRG
jgi:hypothetical protein